MNKRNLFLIVLFSSILSLPNHSIKADSNILRDGIIIGLLTSPTVLTSDLQKALPYGLLSKIIAVGLSKPNNISEAAYKLAVSFGVWTIIYNLRNQNNNTNNHNHHDHHNCGETCSINH